jgi:hypothetical protein
LKEAMIRIECNNYSYTLFADKENRKYVEIWDRKSGAVSAKETTVLELVNLFCGFLSQEENWQDEQTPEEAAKEEALFLQVLFGENPQATQGTWQLKKITDL